MPDRDIEAVCAEWTDEDWAWVLQWDELGRAPNELHPDLDHEQSAAALAYVRRLWEVLDKRQRELLALDGIHGEGRDEYTCDELIKLGLHGDEPPNECTKTPLGRACLRVGEREANDGPR